MKKIVGKARRMNESERKEKKTEVRELEQGKERKE